MDSVRTVACLNRQEMEMRRAWLLQMWVNDLRKSKVHIYAFPERNVVMIWSISVLTYSLLKLHAAEYFVYVSTILDHEGMWNKSVKAFPDVSF